MESRVFELPIGFLDKDGVLHKECEVITMTGEDEEAISERNIANNGGRVITTLLKNKIVRIGSITKITEDMIRRMYSGDRDMALVEIRKLSDNIMYLTPNCPRQNCGEQISYSIDLNNLIVRKWDVDDESGMYTGELGYFDFELPDGVVVGGEKYTTGRLRLPDGILEEQLALLVRENPGKANTAMLTYCIKELGDLKMIDSKLVRSMTRKDRDYLTGILAKYNPGPILRHNVVCSACGYKFTVPIELMYFFAMSPPTDY